MRCTLPSDAAVVKIMRFFGLHHTGNMPIDPLCFKVQ